MTIVDTTVWIDYLGGAATLQTEWLHREINQRPIALTDLILCELLQGIRHDAQFRSVRREMRRFEVFQTGGQQFAVAAAENHRFLRARGVTIRKIVDCLIATSCLMSGHSLLHNDRDFDPFEQHLGLRVIHPKLT